MNDAFFLADIAIGVALKAENPDPVDRTLSSPSLVFKLNGGDVEGVLTFKFKAPPIVDYTRPIQAPEEAIVRLNKALVLDAEPMTIYGSGEAPRIIFDFGILIKKGEFGSPGFKGKEEHPV